MCYHEGMKAIPWEVRKVNTNSRFHRELRKSLSLSDTQKSVLLGSLLGDGCLIENSSKSNFRFQIEHCDKQKEYVFWKYEFFKNFVLTQPKYLSSTNSWKFRTISHQDFLPFHKMFYKNGKKVLPENLSFLIDPMVLAVWYMDDGCRDQGKGYILNTQCFTFEENDRLRKFFEENFGLPFVLHRDRKYFRLFIKWEWMDEFKNLFADNIHPIMRYKINFS